MILAALGHAVLAAACSVSAPGVGPLPASALSVRAGAGWVQWWRSDRAPAQYDSATVTGPLARAVTWTPGASGVEWAEVELSGSGEAWRTRLVAVRIDPRRVTIALDTAFDGVRPAWSIERAGGALVAFNAGQFARSMPWGGVILDGREFLGASVAPLATAVTVTRDGAIRFTHAAAPDTTGVRWAFQSYPTLMAGAAVPVPLRHAGCGVDVAHRDARLALGIAGDGRLLVALTRFDAAGPALGRVPFGLTTPEMAAVMGALGATDAVALDGGISAQLLIRDAAGRPREFPGSRRVPLALVVRAR
ncbi:MAG: phosphodiester glycosidase family protein [Gemmatimonadota bacterium]|nr:phosphodiester glycosidase family protein [Gemmatimonadota bacterium]